MNLHDNRNSTKAAIEAITDIDTLRRMVSYLTERVAFLTTQRDMLKRDRERLKRTLGQIAKRNIRYTVLTPDGLVLARYKTLGCAKRFVAQTVGYDPSELSIREEVVEEA